MPQNAVNWWWTIGNDPKGSPYYWPNSQEFCGILVIVLTGKQFEDVWGGWFEMVGGIKTILWRRSVVRFVPIGRTLNTLISSQMTMSLLRKWCTAGNICFQNAPFSFVSSMSMTHRFPSPDTLWIMSIFSDWKPICFENSISRAAKLSIICWKHRPREL